MATFEEIVNDQLSILTGMWSRDEMECRDAILGAHHLEVEQAVREARIDELTTMQSKTSGGGDWRRYIVQRLDGLDEEKV